MKILRIFVALFLFVSYPDFARSQYVWTQKNNFAGAGRSGGVAFTIGNYAYFGSGSDFSISNTTIYTDFWEYDIITDSWTQKADVPLPQRYGATGFSAGNFGYLGTGFATLNGTPLSSFHQFDPLNNSWITINSLPGLPRYSAIGLSTNNSGYAGFGYGPVMKDFYQYDILAQQWFATPVFPGLSRQSLVGFTIDDGIFIGCGYSSFLLSDFWKFDTQTQSWTQMVSYPHGMYGGIGFAWQGMGFVGLGRTTTQHFNDFHQFNPVTNSWNAITSLPSVGRDGSSACIVGSTAIVLCGRTNANGNLNEVWSLDLATAIASNNHKSTNLKILSVNGGLFVNFTSELNKEFLLRLLDISGKVIYQKMIGDGFNDAITIPSNQCILYSLDDQKSIVKSGKVIVVG